MILTKVLDGVATFTLRRPPVNAISDEWLADFERGLDQLAGARATVLHIRSNEKVFCAGADLDEIGARMALAEGADGMYAYVARIQRLYARIERLPQVTVAEIGGPAMGGGLELALACDLRIAASEARLGLPEARLGLIPGAGGTQRLTRLCGPAVAARLILGAETVDGATARDLGIVQWAVSRAHLAENTAEIVRGIAELPASALAECKACIAAAARPGRDGYADEIEATRRLFLDEETRRRVQAFLAERTHRPATGKTETVPWDST
jgi:enoyl-CoA hydratase/carnithine racemase